MAAVSALSVAGAIALGSMSGSAFASPTHHAPTIASLKAQIAKLQKQLATDVAELAKLQGKGKPAAPTAPTVVYTATSAEGQNFTTPSFHVNNEWQLAYTYNCQTFGGQGNFIVQISQPPGKVGIGVSANDDGPNELGTGGSATESYHYGGTIFLDITSECDWTIKVTD
ncbi:MAG: hypothetical protein FWC87_02230 [Acidimicrobiaceae bacterium]|nr:hypothetical protein [Acidimicrobiaceae bacterium]